jgi:hypothetical protein
MREPLSAKASGSVQGFSLVETLVATTLLALAVAGLAHLATIAAATSHRARGATFATLAASSKVGQLLAVPWDVQLAMAADNDGTLARNVPGYHDLLDYAGVPVAGRGGGDSPQGAAFVRRWSVRRVADEADAALVLEVVVAGVSTHAAGGRILGRLLTIRGRHDWWEPAP